MIALTLICIFCAVIVATGGGSVISLSDRTGETESDVTEIQRLAAENRQRIRENIALTKRVDANADVTTAALCALRGDLEKRVANSTAFLKEHPRGIPGIPAKTIRAGIENQRRTIEALDGIRCH